jgi:putative heme-binding domain-containing protein
LTALNDAYWTVRAHAVELSEKQMRAGIPSRRLWKKLAALAADSSLPVRYQLAFTLGEMKQTERIPVLAQALRGDVGSAWMRAAALSSLREGSGEMFKLLSADEKFCAQSGGREFLGDLTELIGAKNNPADVSDVLNFLVQAQDAQTSFGLVTSLGAGLKRAGVSLADVDKAGRLQAIFGRALKMSSDKIAPEEMRVRAVQLLRMTDYDRAAAPLLACLNGGESIPIQLAAVSTLSDFSSPQIGPDLAGRIPTLTPQVWSAVIGSLLSRPERALALLDAIKAGKLRVHDLTTAQLTFLRNHHDPSVRAAALKIVGPRADGNRQQVVSQFISALNLKGVAAHGREIYLQRCTSCHRLEGQGHQLGPDLVTVKSGGKEKMLVDILDPNREVAPQFQAYEVELKDGDSLVGLIVNQTDTSLTVRQAFGKEDVVLLTNIKQKKSQNQSLMPEGVEAGLKPQDLADLLEYISTAGYI